MCSLFFIGSFFSWFLLICARDLVREAYNLSVKHGAPFYDTVFVALALNLDLELRTLDKGQSRIFSEEEQAARKADA